MQERTQKNAERRKNKKLKKMRNKEKYAARADPDAKDSSGDDGSDTDQIDANEILFADEPGKKLCSSPDNLTQSSVMSVNNASQLKEI